MLKRFLFVLMLIPTASQSAVYRCDVDGGTALQDRPCSSGSQTELVSTSMIRVQECTENSGYSWTENFNGCSDKALLRKACTAENLEHPYVTQEARKACAEFHEYDRRLTPMQRLQQTDPAAYRAAKEKECEEAGEMALGNLDEFLKWERQHPGYCRF